MKESFCVAIGAAGSLLASFFGGFDMGLRALLLFMAVDYFTGMVVAGVFHKSKKTRRGRLESRAGFKGLCRKGMVLFLVLVAHYLDLVTGTVYIRDGVVIAFIVNETISIIENAGLMGVQIPAPLARAVDILQDRQEGGADAPRTGENGQK